MTTDTQVGDQCLGSSPDGDTHRDAERAVLETIGREIALAAEVRAYGLYDYSAYPDVNGGLKPHVVRDELTRKSQVVFESDSPREARLEYERLSSVFVGRRTVEIVGQQAAADLTDQILQALQSASGK